MKRIALVLATVTALFASSAYGQSGGIRNSAHNFTNYAWSGGEICKPCHIPHGGNSQAGALWNHTLSGAVYTTFDGTTGVNGSDALDRVSMLCMSCHDGTVALDSFGGATNGTTFISAGGSGDPNHPYDGAANLGTDLRNDHPIGNKAVYPSATSTSFNPQTVTGTGTSGERHKINTPGGSTSVSLYKMSVSGADAWVVGCKTCHDPHNNGTGSPAHMLKFSNTGSNLCLTCHIK